MTVVRYIVLPHGEGVEAPSYQTDHAAGLDLRAAVAADAPSILLPGARLLIPTGIAIELPQGYEAQIRPRSGLAHRFGITVLNAPGTIDADYRGEVQVLLINLGHEPFEIHRGERIAQMLVCPVTMATLELSQGLSITLRAVGGFGSTGRS
jgi:dUTP pyrophosphatase